MATKKCSICSETIIEEYGKLNGTVVRTINDNKKRELVYVCSDCQKKDDWFIKAKSKE